MGLLTQVTAHGIAQAMPGETVDVFMKAYLRHGFQNGVAAKNVDAVKAGISSTYVLFA